MKYTPYNYQAEAAAAAMEAIAAGSNGLIVLPTGSGKSIVIAEIVKQYWAKYHKRVLIVAHVKELAEQNAEKLAALLPWGVRIGLYCAGLRRKDVGCEITCANIQSVVKATDKFQDVGLVIVDEAHMIPKAGEGQYRTFLDKLSLAIVEGLTATPYRTGSGDLADGPGKIFDSVIYEKPMQELIDEGRLSPLISMEPVGSQINTAEAATTGGEFRRSDIAKAAMCVIAASVEDMLNETELRRSVIVFASDVEHAKSVTGLIQKAGKSVALVLGNTAPLVRSSFISMFRYGSIKYLVNVKTLTTGVDAPVIDCVALMMATKSRGLYSQMVGRGSRVSIPTGKIDCLVLDYGGNIGRHGPVDGTLNCKDTQWKCIKCSAYNSGEAEKCCNCKAAKPKGERQQDGYKLCVVCMTKCASGTKKCTNCGFIFPLSTIEHGHDRDNPITKKDKRAIVRAQVEGVVYSKHAKPGKTPSLRVDYLPSNYSEWVCFEHDGFARKKAIKWWLDRYGGNIVPGTVDEALGIIKPGILREPTEIVVNVTEKFPRIVSHTFPRGEFAVPVPF